MLSFLFLCLRKIPGALPGYLTASASGFCAELLADYSCRSYKTRLIIDDDIDGDLAQVFLEPALVLKCGSEA